MKKITFVLLCFLVSFTTFASSFSACFCKGKVSKFNFGSERYPVELEQTKTVISALYTNNVTGEIQEKVISDVSINRGSGINYELCEQTLENLRVNNICPKL